MAANVLAYQFQPQDPRGNLGPGPGARGAPVYDWGKPLAEAGQATEQLGHGLAVQQFRQAALFATTQTAQARLAAIGALQKAKDGATADAKDFTPNFLTSLDADFKGRLDAAPDDLAKARLNEKLTELKGTFQEEALRFEAGTRKVYGKGQADQALDAATAAAYADPGHQEGAGGDLVEAIQANPYLSEQEKQAYTLAGHQEVTKAAWLRRSIDQPETTLTQLKAGPPEGMAAKDYISLMASTQEKVTQAEKERVVEAKRAAAEAKAAQAQRMAENAATLQQRVQGELDMRGNGVAVRNPITLADVKAAVPAHQVAKVWNQLEDQRNGANAAGLAGKMSFPEQDAMLAELAAHRDAATDDPAEYGNRHQALASAAKAVSAERSAFHEDPAAYVAKSNPKVQAAFADAAQDPAKLPAAVALSMEAQKQINPGLDPSPLPKQAASEAVARWKAAPDAAGKLAAVAAYTVGLARKNPDGSTDDTLGRKATDQLEASGLPAGVDRAIDAARRGDGTNARDMMSWLSVKESDLPKQDSSESRNVEAALNALYQQTNLAAAEGHAAAITGQPGNVQLSVRGRDLLRKGALYYAGLGGEDPAAAVQHAYRTVYGNGETAGSADLGLVPVPRGIDAGQLQTGLAVARQNVDVSHLAPTKEIVKAMLEQDGAKPSDGEVNGMLAQVTADHHLWADDVRQYSRWAPAPGGYQLVLPTGQAVTGAGGKPRVYTTEEVIHHAGGGTAPALVPTAEGELATQGVPVASPAQGKRPGDVPVASPFRALATNRPDEQGLGGSR